MGFSLCNSRVVFFEKIIQKISTLLLLHSEIRRGVVCRQVEQTKNEDLGCST